MSSAFVFWWLALPLLGVPVWLHRRRRQRIKAQPLATARFLPKADPQQLRVWQWVDRVLLLVRCLLLVAAIAWLADVALPWRGDTVLIGPGVDPAWAEQQIAGANFKAARRLAFCDETHLPVDASNTSTGMAEAPSGKVAPTQPASRAGCDIKAANILAWLPSHEREWSAGARLLVVANAGDMPMPASFPPLAHRVDVRVKPAQPSVRKTEHHLVLATTRSAEWRKVFAAFDAAGDGRARYVVDDAPGPQTELIVWDRPEAPPPAWRAPLWWIADASAFAELKQAATLDGLRYADSARGRLWSSVNWPPKDADAARALYESWQQLHAAPVVYALPSQAMAAGRATSLVGPSGSLQTQLAIALAALFALERILSHARRR